MSFRREDYDDLDILVWCGWEKRGFLRKYYTQKLREKDQEEGPEQDCPIIVLNKKSFLFSIFESNFKQGKG